MAGVAVRVTVEPGSSQPSDGSAEELTVTSLSPLSVTR